MHTFHLNAGVVSSSELPGECPGLNAPPIQCPTQVCSWPGSSASSFSGLFCAQLPFEFLGEY